MNENEEISLGTTILKPIESQESCDKYAMMASTVNEHNSSAVSGEYLQAIKDAGEYFEIVTSTIVPAEEESLDLYKESKIQDSKSMLSEYLMTHPLLWSDGKYYSVTTEKQSLLTSNLALYQVATAAGIPFKLTWNSTGDECSEWTYTNLAALALAIGTYVKPFVSHQQELELAIKACTTIDEVEAINISYDTESAATDTTDTKEETTE